MKLPKIIFPVPKLAFCSSRIPSTLLTHYTLFKPHSRQTLLESLIIPDVLLSSPPIPTPLSTPSSSYTSVDNQHLSWVSNGNPCTAEICLCRTKDASEPPSRPRLMTCHLAYHLRVLQVAPYTAVYESSSPSQPSFQRPFQPSSALHPIGQATSHASQVPALCHPMYPVQPITFAWLFSKLKVLTFMVYRHSISSSPNDPHSPAAPVASGIPHDPPPMPNCPMPT